MSGRDGQVGPVGELGEGEPPVLLVEGAEQRERATGDGGAGTETLPAMPLIVPLGRNDELRGLPLSGSDGDLAPAAPYRGRVTDSTPDRHRLGSQAEISDEIAAIAHERRAVRTRRAAAAARLPRPTAAACCATRPRTCTTADPEEIELFAPVFGHRDVGAAESDLTIQHARRAGRRADRRRPAGCSTATGRPVRAPAGRGLAGQRRRPLHPQARPAPRAARPELHRGRPVLTDDDGTLPVHHDQARSLPVEEPPQRVASGAHPLLAVRPASSPSG